MARATASPAVSIVRFRTRSDAGACIRKRNGFCPVYTALRPRGTLSPLVGTVRGPSKYGSLNIKEWLQPRERSPHEAVCGNIFHESIFLHLGRDRCRTGRNGQRHCLVVAGYGPKHLYKDRRDNVGKGQLPAGARSNLQRLVEIGKPKSARGFWSGA